MLEIFGVLATPGFVPFLISGYILVGFLVIEILLMMVGLSSDFGGGDLDADLDVDTDFDLEADIEVALGVTDTTPMVPGNVWSVFDLGRVPMTVWMVCMSAGFSVVGFFLQGIALLVMGVTAPWYVAAVAAVPFGGYIGKQLIDIFTLIFPKTNSDSVSRKTLGGAVGRVTLGIGTADLPARAEVRDRYGKPHNIRVIPYTGEPDLQKDDQIMTLRGPGPIYYAMTLKSATTRLKEGQFQ